jgi:hypothetical protein
MKQIISAALPFLLLTEPTLATTESYLRHAPKIVFGLDAPHLHLLTNHFPIFVTLSGLVVLAIGLLRKNRGTVLAALILLWIGIVGGILTFWLGQQSYKPVRGLADETGQDWLDIHMERADQVSWIFWLAALSVTAALVLGCKRARIALPAAVVAGLLGASTLGLSMWIAAAGGQIRHDEMRSEVGATRTDGESEPYRH